MDYPAEQFDLVVSMDTMYFAPDMEKLVQQIIKWLKKDGVLFVGYQEGDVIFTENPFAQRIYLHNGYESRGYASWRKGKFDLMEKKL